MKILVTDGNNRAALAITRSLGQKGHTIIVGDYQYPSLASSSKYCRDHILYPNPTENPDGFINEVIASIKEKRIDVLLPVSDVTTIPVCENKERLERFCKVPFPGARAVNLAADKSELFRLARDLGVPIPSTLRLESYNDLQMTLTKISFPVVIKPSRSRVPTQEGWVSTSVKYADSEEELRTILKAESPLAYPVLLQERITGPGIGVFSCYNRGKPLAFFSHRRLREKPPSGGVSVLRESIPLSPMARDISTQLLNHLQWHGVAMVEFKMDDRDNIPKLMEINGRFWGSLQLAIDAGVDFPALLIATLGKEEVAPVESYRLGVKTRWLMGDLDSLLMILFKDRKKLKLPAGHRGRLPYLLEFLKLWEKNSYYEVLKWHDLKPWVFEFTQWCRQKKG
jgi:predicted ATP-grasp superfamily ATP-dependent carboligase